MSEWLLFNAKWVNECCLIPNEWMNVAFTHLALNNIHSLIWDYTTFILSFGIEHHSFSHFALNHNYSLIWHWTTFIHSFGIKQHSFTHLALNNIHSLIWHWEWKLFNTKWVSDCCSMPNKRMKVVQCQMSE
jgi:hypothetical protein